MYPSDAVAEIKDQMLALAKKWYRIGARRGALETIKALLDGNLEARKKADGSIEIVAHSDKLLWQRGLTVTVGDEKVRIKRRKYTLDVKADLEFK